MIQLPEDFDSIFRYIVVVSQRAEQIINGAKPRTESRFKKPTLKARDDVDGGAVDWRILTQEELDAHRQAMVEQFRAEVDAASEQQAEQAIPDVLPTGEAPAAVPAAPVGEDSEKDDELARLQRLLGMTQQIEAADDTEEEAAADEPKKDTKKSKKSTKKKAKED